MVDKDKILGLLNQYFDTTGEITIDDRGFVTCIGNVTLKQMFKHERLPVSFDKVEGDFKCWQNTLKTLEGVPKSVLGHFMCNTNQLTSLEHAPKSVRGHFMCAFNDLTSLEHAPTSVGGSFLCNHNKLTKLAHSPRSVRGNFVCSFNRLETLAGAPRSVDGFFSCTDNLLTSLEHAPNSVGNDFSCFNNPLETLEGLPDVTRTLRLSYSPTLPLLRCLLAKKVEFLPTLGDKTIEAILHRYAGQGEAGAFACGAELASAGYKENAKW